VKKDLQQALKWYRLAAQKDEAMAQANLGLMYQDGAGVPPDMIQAYKWFSLSAEQGNVVGKHSFDDYNEHHRLTTNQLAEAERMVAEFHAQTRTNQPASAPRYQPSAKQPVSE
jgi:TPR repeat protein